MTPTIAPKPLVPLFFGLLASFALFCLWRLCLPVDAAALRGPRMSGPLRLAVVRPRPLPFCRCALPMPPPPLAPAPPLRSVAVVPPQVRLPDRLGNAGRLVPAIRDGVTVGYHLYAIRPQSWAARLGLENGDIVERVDAVDVDTPDRARWAVTRLSHARQARIDLERRGAAVELIYQHGDRMIEGGE